MIYLDNAAGSFPKPAEVEAALAQGMGRFGANPGRGNYQLTRDTAAMVAAVRSRLARLIKAPDPSRVVFTAGATASLNLAVFGLLRPEFPPPLVPSAGQNPRRQPAARPHVLCSSMEHNALFRPLALLADRGEIELELVRADCWGYLEPQRIAAALRPQTQLIALSHASNVCGSVQPLAEIGRLARERQVPLLVDAAQSAGLLELDVEAQNISLLALAGHKALYGPAGIGALWVSPRLELAPLLYGGTGANSELRGQPETYPEHLEAGSLNTAGIYAWGAALDFVAARGPAALLRHANGLTAYLAQLLRPLPGVELQLDAHEQRPRAPVLSLTVGQMDCAELASRLDQRGICLRAGYHCAPLAHRSLGTYDQGTLRFSPGVFNTRQEMEETARAVAESLQLSEGRGQR